MSDRPRSCFGVFPSDFGLTRLSSGAALFSSAIPFLLLLLLKLSISECPPRRVVSVSRSFLQSETYVSSHTSVGFFLSAAKRLLAHMKATLQFLIRSSNRLPKWVLTNQAIPLSILSLKTMPIPATLGLCFRFSIE